MEINFSLVWNAVITIILVYIIKLLKEKSQAKHQQTEREQDQQQIEAAKSATKLTTPHLTEAKSKTSTQFEDMNPQAQVYRVCLTGGPCAGKTSALSYLVEKFSEQGYKVLCVPEAATLLNKAGALIDTRKYSLEGAVKFQTSLIKLQMSLEDIILEISQLNPEQKFIVLCDRGVMDGQAYCQKGVWQALLDDQGWTNVQLRDKRYEIVIHLVTAADGAEDFYTGEGNVSRYEDNMQAIKIDRALQKAWTGHPNLTIIDNRYSFDQKLKQAYITISKYLGQPNPVQFFKKFLIRVRTGGIPVLPEELYVEKVNLEETFIKCPEGEIHRIRKRGAGGNNTYHQIIEYEKTGQRIERKRQISSREFMQLLELRDTQRKTVKKLRQCFIHKRLHLQLETMLNLRYIITILRIETDNDSSEINIPPFIEVIREITMEPAYSTYTLAKKDYYVDENDMEFMQEAPDYVSEESG